MNTSQKHEALAFQIVITWLGDILVICSDSGLVNVVLPGWEGDPDNVILQKYPDAVLVDDNLFISEAAKQIKAYFLEKRTKFDLRLDLRVTPFQKKVLEQVYLVPFAKTATYGEIAKGIGNSDASRAVGMANNKNPIPIIIPCHRIVGVGGKLVGYAGGVEMKHELLMFEQRVAGVSLF